MRVASFRARNSQQREPCASRSNHTCVTILHFLIMSQGVVQLATRISQSLRVAGKPALAKHQASYMKNVVQFYGLRLPETRQRLNDEFGAELSKLTREQALEVANVLIASPYAEDKVRQCKVRNILYLIYLLTCLLLFLFFVFWVYRQRRFPFW